MGRKTYNKHTRNVRSKSLIGRAIENTLSIPDPVPAFPACTAPVRTIERVCDAVENTSILEATNSVNAFCDLLETVTQRYVENSNIVHQSDLVICDLLHEAELLPSLNARDCCQFYKNIRNARLRRRAAKTENIILEPVYKYVNAHNFSVEELRQLNQRCTEVNSKVKNYQYTYRIQEDSNRIDSW